MDLKNENMAEKRLLMIVNVGWFFLSHRLPIAIAAKRAGFEVHVAAALDALLDVRTPEILSQHGLVLHHLPLSRSGSGLWEMACNLLAVGRLCRRLRPSIVHAVGLKPIVVGGLSARIVRVPAVVLAVPGRGTVFSSTGFLPLFRRWLALLLYRIAYRKRRARVIVQNEEDGDYFIKRRVFSRADVRLIRGSGVDIESFTVKEEPNCNPIVVLASRMLKEKGIEDFVRAASKLKRQGVKARFVLVGMPDSGNPSTHTRDELVEWAAQGDVEWWGQRNDMPQVFASCHIACLPTFYGEGVPKVLIEAAASGRPIVTTNVPGCRDIVIDGENGILVPPRNVPALAHALTRLIADPYLRARMGERGRRRVEAHFSLDTVVREHLSTYAELDSLRCE